MNGRYMAAISYLGAHLVLHRDKHEIDRAVQRAVICSIIFVLTLWHACTSNGLPALVLTLPVVAAAYAGAALVYLRMIRALPGRGVMAQYVFIILDPVLTVVALAGMPLVLGPLNPLLLAQIVRCGIRFGVRTMWLTWAGAAAASVTLLPLSSLWLLREPMTQSYIVMLAITPILFGPLIRHGHRVTNDLRAAATSDPLTGLGNRRMLSEHLLLAQERNHRDQSMLALILFDLDNFKMVNDSLGHAKGDELLTCVAATIKEHSRGGDLLTRIGGDEFVLLLEGLTVHGGQQQADQIAQKILGAVSAAGQKVCPTVPVTASVGVKCWSFATEPTARAVDLIEFADTAMYAAKRAGRARVSFAMA